jgi:CxxH/CxxC protein (TIGR04129 family)
MLRENKYCCEEHVDIAIDEFLVENETFPNLEKIKDKKCDYCDKKAQYVLK